MWSDNYRPFSLKHFNFPELTAANKQVEFLIRMKAVDLASPEMEIPLTVSDTGRNPPLPSPFSKRPLDASYLPVI